MWGTCLDWVYIHKYSHKKRTHAVIRQLKFLIHLNGCLMDELYGLQTLKSVYILPRANRYSLGNGHLRS